MWATAAPSARFCDPVFTFDTDRKGLVNFKKTFVALGDVTGYQWAIKYLGSWDHWLYLMKRDWFQEQYEAAKDELHTKIRSEALARIGKISSESENEVQKLAASKYLAECGWDKKRAGRPNKALRTPDDKKEMETIDEDASRMGLTVITGGKES